MYKMFEVVDEQFCFFSFSFSFSFFSFFLLVNSMDPLFEKKKYGLSAVFANQESIKAITMALKSSRIKTVTMVLEILSAVCFIPSGHERIMEGQKLFKKKKNQFSNYDYKIIAIDELAKETFTRRRFSSIVNLLSRDDASYDRIVNLQVIFFFFSLQL